MPPRDLIRERLLGLVTWEWQDVEVLMEQLIPIVHPGLALRTYENRQGQHVKGNTNRPKLTEDQKIASGARSIVNDRIGAQVESGRLELDKSGPDGKRRVRFKERRQVADSRGCCPTCNRPFGQAAVTTPRPSPLPPKSKVVYVAFPKWDEAQGRSSG